MITRILILMLAFGIFFTAFADPADAQRRKMRTAAEIVEYLDLNLDGEVDREEFVKGDRIFDLIDTDNNNSLTVEEYETRLEFLKQKRNRKAGRKGKRNRGGQRNFGGGRRNFGGGGGGNFGGGRRFGGGGGGGQRSPAEVVANLDRDGDNKLSLEEYPRGKKIFNRIDADGDGYLTVEEFVNIRRGGSQGGQKTARKTDQPARKKAVSLEEAKKITPKFQGRPFTPPPKSISDIAAILDQQKVVDTAAFKKETATANGKPPNGADDKKMPYFYYKRAKARIAIGMSNEALGDIRKAYEIMEGAGYLGKRLTGRIKNMRGKLEHSLGNFKQAIALQKKFMEEDKRITVIAGLVKTYIKSGDLDSARKIMKKFEKKFNRMAANPRVPERSKAIAKLENADLRVLLLEAEGRWKKPSRSIGN